MHGEVAINPLPALRQQELRGVVRCRALRRIVEQALQEGLERLGTPRLVSGGDGLRPRLRGRGARETRLVEPDRGAGGEEGRDRDACGDCQRMPPHELTDANHDPVRPCLQGPAVEMALDVVAQQRHVRIAPKRIGPRRLLHDRVEIRAERSPQGLAIEGRAVRVERVRVATKSLSAQQFRQQHAEGVDVDRGRCRVTGELLGRRVGAGHAPGLRASRLSFARQELGDAEVHELDAALRAD